jgi:hypothetical protein
MEQRPVRRRRRRRRSGTAQRETIAWLTFFVSLGRRAARWTGLLLIIAVILILGLGAPMTPFDKILSFWGHW